MSYKPATADRESIQAAYDDVRLDTSDVNWATFTYTDSTLAHGESGVSYEDLLTQLTDDNRLFAFVRMLTGDELSKRAKFVLITWIGVNVKGLDRAHVSGDKIAIKGIIQNIAIEIHADDLDDVTEEVVKSALSKASGANYGTGVRD